VTGVEAKAAARKAALARRKVAQASADQTAAHAALRDVLAPWRGRALSGYMPIRTEIDPRPVMADWAAEAPVCVPVIAGRDAPLDFRQWTPAAAMVEGPFGARVPEAGDWLTPEVLIVPLLAFSGRGYRLGYGGGFYDRTLARLRARGPVFAVGFAFAAQRDDALPLEATDQPLDAVVTEAGTLVPQRGEGR